MEAKLMMTSTLFLLCVLFGSLQVVTGTEYYDSSNYKIINDVAKCRDLGNDWNPAIVDDSYELTFLHSSFQHSCQCYQIGGTTNDTTSWTLALSRYFPDDSGISRVSAWLGCKNDNYYLTHSGNYFAPSNQIICEKYKQMSKVNSKLEFVSPQSCYKILLNNSANHNFTYWSKRCEDLGDGWSHAVLNSEEELNFIREGQKRNRELGSYFIGGSTDAKEGSTLNYADIYTNGSGSQNILINPGKRRKINFRLKSRPASRRTPGILCEREITKPVYTGFELASKTKKYRKLVVNPDYGMSYEAGVFYCSKLGNGWKLAVLDSQEEYEFIRQGQRSFNNSVPYWIDGSANATLNEFFNYIDYIADNSDENGVVVRTDRTIESRIKGLPPPAILFDKNTYLLQVNSRESVVAAILCEHEINTTGCEFASAESYYKKIVGSANNYSYYVSKCKELGNGWGPTVLETQAENDFIRQSQKGCTDAGDYFIGGSAFPEETGPFDYHVSVAKNLGFTKPVDPVYSTRKSVNVTVYVSTYDSMLMKHSNNQFALVSALPNTTSSGILCEKEMAKVTTILF